jgi:hypothetical protein
VLTTAYKLYLWLVRHDRRSMRNASIRAVSSRCSYLIMKGALSYVRVANPSVKAVAQRCLISWLHDLSLSQTVSPEEHGTLWCALNRPYMYRFCTPCRSAASPVHCGVIHSDFGAGTVYLKHRLGGPVRHRRRWCPYWESGEDVVLDTTIQSY